MSCVSEYISLVLIFIDAANAPPFEGDLSPLIWYE